MKKLVEFERNIAAEKGPFTLCALFQREEYIDDWDLLVAAPWIDDDICYAIDYLIDRLQATFTPTEMLTFAAVHTTNAYHPGVAELVDEFPVEHGIVRVPADDYLGRSIRRGYLITAQCDPVAAAAWQAEFIPRNGSDTLAPHPCSAPAPDRRRHRTDS